jgi:hypothetical protein
VDLNPNYIEGHETLIWYLAWSGRRDEALSEVEKMRRLDPVFPFIHLEEAGSTITNVITNHWSKPFRKLSPRIQVVG